MSERPEHLTATEYFCPACGSQAVLVDELSDDYYCGCTHICQTCHARFHLPGGASAADSKMIKDLKDAIANLA